MVAPPTPWLLPPLLLGCVPSVLSARRQATHVLAVCGPALGVSLALLLLTRWVSVCATRPTGGPAVLWPRAREKRQWFGEHPASPHEPSQVPVLPEGGPGRPLVEGPVCRALGIGAAEPGVECGDRQWGQHTAPWVQTAAEAAGRTGPSGASARTQPPSRSSLLRVPGLAGGCVCGRFLSPSRDLSPLPDTSPPLHAPARFQTRGQELWLPKGLPQPSSGRLSGPRARAQWGPSAATGRGRGGGGLCAFPPLRAVAHHGPPCGLTPHRPRGAGPVSGAPCQGLSVELQAARPPFQLALIFIRFPLIFNEKL